MNERRPKKGNDRVNNWMNQELNESIEWVKEWMNGPWIDNKELWENSGFVVNLWMELKKVC